MLGVNVRLHSIPHTQKKKKNAFRFLPLDACEKGKSCPFKGVVRVSALGEMTTVIRFLPTFRHFL